MIGALYYHSFSFLLPWNCNYPLKHDGLFYLFIVNMDVTFLAAADIFLYF
jgi:hypothetical protein